MSSLDKGLDREEALVEGGHQGLDQGRENHQTQGHGSYSAMIVPTKTRWTNRHLYIVSPPKNKI